MGLPISDNVSNLLTKFLDVQSQRTQVVAGNLANADTPGYVAKELDFTDYLRDAAQEALSLSGANDASKNFIQAPRVIDQTPGTIGLDGNTVDQGREMSTLAEAGMQYLTGTQLLQSRLRTLRSAIREGR